MAKKKKNAPVQQALSPEKYIQTKARNLPVEECLIGEGWQEIGLATIVVARRHTNGNYTLGIYLADTFCLGVKSSMYRFNISAEEYEEYKEQLSQCGGLLPISYNEAHNVIFGSIDYAEELGIEPCKEFKLTHYLLEEDTDDIPLIDYEFGKDGKPCLIVDDALEGSRYLPLLEDATGGDYRYFIKDEEFIDEEEAEFIDKYWTEVEYAYECPEYPKELQLTHPELMALFDNEYETLLPKVLIDDLLSLPRKTLVADLEQIILYTIGETNRKLKQDIESDEYECALLHSMNLLAELKSEESLNTILEVMRQNSSFMDLIFGDTSSLVFSHVLYHIGANKLQEIQQYLMEPGLNTYFRYNAFFAMRSILEAHPERREEFINWWRNVLNLFIEQVDNKTVFDAVLMGLMMVDLSSIKAIELLPEIEQLFKMKRVDTYCAGDYEKVKKKMNTEKLVHDKFEVLDIYDWYALYHKVWGAGDAK